MTRPRTDRPRARPRRGRGAGCAVDSPPSQHHHGCRCADVRSHNPAMSADGASVVCSACGDLVARHRLENHALHWCAARAGADDDSEDGSSDEEQMQRVREMIAGVRTASPPPSERVITKGIAPEPQPEPEQGPQQLLEAQREEPSAARVAGWGSKLQSMATVTLLGLPLTLRFEQQSVFGDTSTGGALWRAELLLAEWCIRELQAQGPTNGWVVELGCGVAPAAGLACAALGADVLFTDLAKVLPLTEANLRLNVAALSQARSDANASPFSRASCDTVAYEFSALMPPRLDAMVQELPARPGMILCSDCLFWQSLHDPLALAIAGILRTGTAAATAAGVDDAGAPVAMMPRCAVAHQRRNEEDGLFFTRSCPAHGLRCVASPIDELLASSHFAELAQIGDQLGDFLYVTEVMLA